MADPGLRPQPPAPVPGRASLSDTDRAARLLRELRIDRGWSWQREAETLKQRAQELGCERVALAAAASITRSIARWESGRYHYRPDDQYQLVLASVFSDVTSDLERLLEALAAFGLPPLRLEALRRRAAATLPVAEPRVEEDASGAQASALLERAADRLRGLEGTVPFASIQQALVPITTRFRSLVGAAGSGGSLRPSMARHLRFVGRVAFELHDATGANLAYREAADLADDSADAALQAAVLTSWSLVTLHGGGGVEEAAPVAARARRAAARSGDREVVARVLALEAELAARSGDWRDAGPLLYRAAAELSWRGPTPAAGFGDAHLAGFEGLCALLAGTADGAVPILTAAAKGLERHSVQRGIVLANLSAAHTLAGEPEKAARTLIACADTVSVSRGRVALQRLHRARRKLDPWTAEPFVLELDERLLTAVFT